MKILDKHTWNRKEHFEFFSSFDEPYFGVTLNIDVTSAYKKCKELNMPFFLYYHHLSSKAANEIEEFKYRLQGDDVLVCDKIHVSTNIMREDHTFSFSFIEYDESFEIFTQNANKEIERIKNSTGLGLGTTSQRQDTIQYSTIPWINFTGLTHARHFPFKESVPKISFGKIEVNNKRRLMPLAVFVHHGLMDGYHVGLFTERFQELLNE